MVEGEDLHLTVTVFRGKGGKRRVVPVRPDFERDVLDLIAGYDAKALVFPNLPDWLRVHVKRRESAQGRYTDIAGRPLPQPDGRLDPHDYDPATALEVNQALGHNRIDVVTRHYLR